MGRSGSEQWTDRAGGSGDDVESLTRTHCGVRFVVSSHYEYFFVCLIVPASEVCTFVEHFSDSLLFHSVDI